MDERPAYAVCRIFWNARKPRCQGCPVMTQCHAPVAPLTRETLLAHSDVIDAAATVWLGNNPEAGGVGDSDG